MVKKLLEHNVAYYDMLAARRNFINDNSGRLYYRILGYGDCSRYRQMDSWSRVRVIPDIAGQPGGLTGHFYAEAGVSQTS
jgi:hypothetical protein